MSDTTKDTFNLLKTVEVSKKHSNLNYFYGPYASIDEAKEATMYIRDVGYTVLIGDDINGYEEYWWKDTITGDPVKKNSSMDLDWEELVEE